MENFATEPKKTNNYDELIGIQESNIDLIQRLRSKYEKELREEILKSEEVAILVEDNENNYDSIKKNYLTMYIPREEKDTQLFL